MTIAVAMDVKIGFEICFLHELHKYLTNKKEIKL